jgi:RNA polymerase-binding transcription factor DksA
MDKKLIEELNAKLEEQKKSIQKELESFATEDPNLKHNWETKYPSREDSDKDEAADDAQEYDNALSLEYSLELKLKDVTLALEKISALGGPASGWEYGICERCGKEIEKERLKAVPEAKFCIKDNN